MLLSSDQAREEHGTTFDWHMEMGAEYCDGSGSKLPAASCRETTPALPGPTNNASANRLHWSVMKRICLRRAHACIDQLPRRQCAWQVSLPAPKT